MLSANKWMLGHLSQLRDIDIIPNNCKSLCGPGEKSFHSIVLLKVLPNNAY